MIRGLGNLNYPPLHDCRENSLLNDSNSDTQKRYCYVVIHQNDNDCYLIDSYSNKEEAIKSATHFNVIIDKNAKRCSLCSRPRGCSNLLYKVEIRDKFTNGLPHHMLLAVYSAGK